MSDYPPVTENDLDTLVVVLHDPKAGGLVARLVEIRRRGNIAEGLLVWQNPDQSKEKRRWFALSTLVSHEALKDAYPGGQSAWYSK